MSLIYDYLKIHGKDDPESGPDVEIPPVLKRRDPRRLDSRSLLLIIGSCAVGILFFFLIIKIFSPGQYEPVIVGTEADTPARVEEGQTAETAPPVTPDTAAMPAVEVQVAPEKAAPAEEILIEPDKAPAAETIVIDIQAVETRQEQPIETSPPITPETGVTQIIETRAAVENAAEVDQVFVEPEKAAVTETVVIDIQPAEVRQEPQGVIPKKTVQPLKLESAARKIVFPENAPVYTEPEEIPKSKVDYSPEPAGRIAAPQIKPAVLAPAGSAALEQSKKFYQAGLQAQQKGDGRLAEIYYNRALEENPDHLEAMINLSALFVQQERYPEAEEILVDILAIDATNSKALVNMGVVNLYSGDENQAAARFRAALAANPTEENALVNLIYLAEKNRDYAAAERYYRQLLQISPDNIEALLAYGHLLEEQARFQEAIALYADTRELAAVKKDQRLYDRISERIRMLAGAVNR